MAKIIPKQFLLKDGQGKEKFGRMAERSPLEMISRKKNIFRDRSNKDDGQKRQMEEIFVEEFAKKMRKKEEDGGWEGERGEEEGRKDEGGEEEEKREEEEKERKKNGGEERREEEWRKDEGEEEGRKDEGEEEEGRWKEVREEETKVQILKEHPGREDNNDNSGKNSNPFQETRFDTRFPVHNLCGPWSSGRQASNLDW